MKGWTARDILGMGFGRLPRVSQVALALALAALWLLGRRYGGIKQDATLYLVQGLRRLDPESFDKDLFFTHGAQDSYTVFPVLFAPLIELVGAGNAALLITLTGQVAFAAASLWLVFCIAAGPARWWALALLATISGYYGGVGVIRLAEPFATARSLAEPLVLAAFACTLGARHRIALALLAAAAVLHPLVSAPGIAAISLWHAFGRPRSVWSIPVLIGLTLAAAVAWVGLPQRFDPEWRTVILERSSHLFISRWLLPDWSRYLWGFCVAWMALRYLDKPVRCLVVSVGALGAGGVVASWIAVDLLDHAFAAALQLWRAHWLLHFLAIVLVPVVVAGLWRSGNAARIAAASVAASCCFGRAELPASLVLMLLALALDASERRRPGWMGEGAFRLALLLVVCAASVGLMFEVQSRLPSVYGAVQTIAWTQYVDAATSVGGLLPLAVLLWLAARSRLTLVALGSTAAAFAVSAAAWDARLPWSRFVEQASGGMNPFREKITPHAVVFWPGPYGKAWLVLGKATWFSEDQGAGVVFNRETAIHFARRKLASETLRSAIGNCEIAGRSACRIDARPVRELCERRDGPDFLVLNAPVDGYRGVEWRLPEDMKPAGQSLFLFDCRAFAGNEKGRRRAGLSFVAPGRAYSARQSVYTLVPVSA